MPDQDSGSIEHLEQARDVIWDALRMLEDTQRILYRAGDRYVTQVWGEGVRSVIEVTERITDLSGDLMAIHIEIGRLTRKDASRDLPPP